MTHREQKRFIRELVKNVQKSLLENVSKHPVSWDGHELRRLIAERFKQADFGTGLEGARGRAYRNDVIVNNLL